MKRKIFIKIIASFCLCFFMTFFASSMMAMKVNAHYDEVSIETEELCLDTISTDNIQKLSASDNAKSSEEDFIVGLNKQYAIYNNMFLEENSKEEEITIAKMNMIENIIELYELYNDEANTITLCPISSNCMHDSTSSFSEIICEECENYLKIKIKVFTIASLFAIRGWTLASDLMIHNMYNKELDSDYIPSNDLLVNLKASPQICEDIAWNDVVNGAYGAISPGKYNGLLEEIPAGDTYNSLGSFYYTKNYLGTNVVKISILDRYDWKHIDDDSLPADLNNILFEAQDLGIVTPFYTKIDIITEGFAPLAWGYNDDCIEIIGAADSLSSYIIPELWYDLRERVENLPTINKVIIFDTAFSNHENLVSITMSDKVVSIGANAFENCISLEEVNISSSVKTIGKEAFKDCASLEMIEMCDSIEYIGDAVFENCITLQEIDIPTSIDYVGEAIFNNCEELSIYIPSKTKPLGWANNWYGDNVTVVWGGRNRSLETDTLTLSNYTFPSSYNDFNPISETINTQSGKSVVTNRLRCGVIEHDNKSYLTLSAKNRNATQAYIEYYFHEYVVELNYQLALWSSSESLINNSSIRLEILYNNEWIVVREFSAKELSQSKDELLDYNIELQIPSKAIRFIVDTNQVYNDNNRGRLVIGDINVTMVHIFEVEKYDNELHCFKCDCGDYYYQRHLVTEKFEKNGHYYGFCDVCGDLIDLANVIIPDIKQCILIDEEID